MGELGEAVTRYREPQAIAALPDHDVGPLVDQGVVGASARADLVRGLDELVLAEIDIPTVGHRGFGECLRRLGLEAGAGLVLGYPSREIRRPCRRV